MRGIKVQGSARLVMSSSDLKGQILPDCQHTHTGHTFELGGSE